MFDFYVGFSKFFLDFIDIFVFVQNAILKIAAKSEVTGFWKFVKVFLRIRWKIIQNDLTFLTE